MPVRTSLIPKVRGRLVDLFGDWLGADVDVFYGLEAGAAPSRDCVIVFGLAEHSQVAALMGDQSVDEAFGFYCQVWSATPGRTPRESYERAFDVLGALEVQLRPSNRQANLGLGADGLLWARIGRVQDNDNPTREGQITILEFVVACFGRM